MVSFETRVVDIVKRTHDVKSFRFKVEKDPDFKPGQFFFVTIKVDGAERTKHFSFSNSPTEKGYVEFTKRITESDFSKALDELKPGDWARLKMPYGNFTFEGKHKKIALLSGGIGITPLRSMCKFSVDNKLQTSIVLLYGNNKEEEIIFRQDLDTMRSENKNMRLVYTLGSADVDKKSWSGRTGYIDEDMIKEEIPDYSNRVFYVCGPPQMVKSLVSILKDELGVKESEIKLENFTGY